MPPTLPAEVREAEVRAAPLRAGLAGATRAPHAGPRASRGAGHHTRDRFIVCRPPRLSTDPLATASETCRICCSRRNSIGSLACALVGVAWPAAGSCRLDRLRSFSLARAVHQGLEQTCILIQTHNLTTSMIINKLISVSYKLCTHML